ncbi:MAG: hypothetical protein ACE5FH_03105 [Candidatus Zixiibacteriota bacterium]
MHFSSFFDNRAAAELTQPLQTVGSIFSVNGVIEMIDGRNTGFSEAEATHPEDIMYQNAATCPDCGGGMVRYGSCFSCLSCGLSSCGG